jgi:hypothetical protein
VDGVRYHVCKNYFLATLGVSESFVHNALRNQQGGGVYLGTDKRGKHEPHSKATKNAMENNFCKHDNGHHPHKMSTTYGHFYFLLTGVFSSFRYVIVTWLINGRCVIRT